MTVSAEALRDSKTGRFQPGNPGGKLKQGSRNIQGLLEEALKAAQKLRAQLHEPCSCVLPETSLWLVAPSRHPKETDGAYQVRLQVYKDTLWERSCKTADQHFARRLFASDTVLIAFQKKRIPDLQHQTGHSVPTQITIMLGHRKIQIAQPERANA